jgi:hypothetical protein
MVFIRLIFPQIAFINSGNNILKYTFEDTREWSLAENKMIAELMEEWRNGLKFSQSSKMTKFYTFAVEYCTYS